MKAMTVSVTDDWTCRNVFSPTVFTTGGLVRVLLREQYIRSVGSRVCVCAQSTLRKIVMNAHTAYRNKGKYSIRRQDSTHVMVVRTH
jgi:hypothetical protein